MPPQTRRGARAARAPTRTRRVESLPRSARSAPATAAAWASGCRSGAPPGSDAGRPRPALRSAGSMAPARSFPAGPSCQAPLDAEVPIGLGLEPALELSEHRERFLGREIAVRLGGDLHFLG